MGISFVRGCVGAGYKIRFRETVKLQKPAPKRFAYYFTVFGVRILCWFLWVFVGVIFRFVEGVFCGWRCLL